MRGVPQPWPKVSVELDAPELALLVTALAVLRRRESDGSFADRIDSLEKRLRAVKVPSKRSVARR